MSLIRFFVRRRLRARGYSDYSITGIMEEVQRGLLQRNEYSFGKKIWAVRHGFQPDKLSWYNLNKNNYQDFISDFEYTWLFPINGIFNFWLDDKITYKYLLTPFAAYLPEYYFQVERGEILRLMDCPDGLPASIDGIIALLKLKGSLAAKLVEGFGAKGFLKLSFNNDGFFLNDKPSSESAITVIISDWIALSSGYLLTEYLKPHSTFAKIWNKAPNSIRITVTRIPGQIARITFAYVRFGSRSTGVIDNVTKGGVSCLINTETGEFSQGRKPSGERFQDCHIHPDSGEPLEGTVPHWQLIKEKLLEIFSHLPQMSIMGFDVAVVENGFKIHEINSLPAIYNIQTYVPAYKDRTMAEYFRFKVTEKNNKINPAKRRD